MKAIQIRAHGGLEVLERVELERPRPGLGEVLVRVRAVALNHLDLFVRRGMPGVRVPLPMILGSDIAGEVEELGEGVDRVWLGRRVMLYPGRGCGSCEYCYGGEVSMCSGYGILGEHWDGGYREYIAIGVEHLVEMPEGVSFVEAAAFPLVFLTAWRMMIERGRVRAGEDVLILGASGGVGVAALQLAKLAGARVYVAAGTEAKLERLRSLGADVGINYVEEPDFHRVVRRMTGGRGVDVVVDYVGEETWVKSLKSLCQGGRLLTCGATTGAHPRTDLLHIFYRQLEVIGSTMGSKRDMLLALRCWREGRIRPVVDRVLPLEEVAEAHRLLEERRVFGKVVLEV